MSTSDEWDPAAQDVTNALTQGMSAEERAELIREACPDMSEAEVQAWATDRQRRRR